MKKILLIICISLLLVGCSNKDINKSETTSNEQTTTETNSTTTESTTTSQIIFQIELNKEYIQGNKNSDGSEFIFKKNNKVEAGAWGKNAGGTDYQGTYKIDNNILTIKITDYQDIDGSWRKLPDSEIKTDTYTLISNDSFKDVKGNIWKIN